MRTNTNGGGSGSGANAPVTLSANTNLTHVAHANRTIFVDTAGVVLTINNDATGLWVTGDSLYIEPTGAGTFTLVGGSATLTVPTGSSAASATAISGVVGADWRAANSWLATSPAVPSGTIDRFNPLKTRFAITKPAGDNNAVWSSMGNVSPSAFDTSVLSLPAVNDDALGRLSPLQYLSAANAVNRGAGATWIQGPLIDVSSTGTELFPCAWTMAITDANPTDGCAWAGFSIGVVTADPSAGIDRLGFGFDVADANWQIMHNDGSGVCTKIDLGASFVRATRTPYLFVVDRPSTAATYDLYAVNLATGAVSAVSTVSTNLPINDRSSSGVHRWSMAVAFQASMQTNGMVRGKIV